MKLQGGLEFLRERWGENGRGDPQRFQDISDMMHESFANKIPLREWKLYAPIFFILV